MTFVFLHGFAGLPSSWDAVRESLGASSSTLCIGLAGHDAALAPPTDFDSEVERLIASLPPEPVALVGYSLGARLALRLAERAPSRVRSLALVSCNPGLHDPAARADRVEADERWARRFETEPLPDVLTAWESQPLFATQRRVAPERLSARRAARLTLSGPLLAAAMRALSLGAMPVPALETLRLPVQLIVGVEDTKFVDLARAAQRRLPRATLHAVERCGHDVPLERPHALARLLMANQEATRESSKEVS